jgi:rifampicin phosphotransferase
MRRMRPALLAVGDGLVAAKALRSADDLHYCTFDEVGQLVKGRPVEGMSAAITRRKKQRAAAEDYTLPNSWVGSVVAERRAATTDATELTGLGVSVGSATGVARVILNTEAAFARDIEPGEILVAPFTDTPWTPLFIPAAAVVVETGGVLSHAATVAREFGIPCVVLVADATRLILDGDTIAVDGAAGTVRIISRAR